MSAGELRDLVPGTTGRPIAVLTGPTGTGKSDFALRLAQRISDRDRQCRLRAGVSRARHRQRQARSPDTVARGPHHLIDLVEPSESYSAGQFVRDAADAIADIEARGRIPLLVGGTMLYLRALHRRHRERCPRASGQIRAEIEADAKRDGWPALHARLAQVDARAAARIHPNDAQRIQRALEVFMRQLAGPSRSCRQATRAPLARDFAVVALVPGRPSAAARKRLAQRFEQHDGGRTARRGAPSVSRAAI